MLPRHANELLSRLERVADIGCAEVRNGELLWWYDQDRLTIGIWRDIEEKWQEVLEKCGEQDRDTPLLVAEAHGLWVFIWGQGLTTSQKSWFQDIRELAKRKQIDEAA